MVFSFYSEDKEAVCSCRQTEKDGITTLVLHIHYDQPTMPRQAVLRWNFPCSRAFSTWNPELDFTRSLNPDWNKQKAPSRLAFGAPVHSILSLDGKNTITVAVSDTATPLTIESGVCEETAFLDMRICFFTYRVAPLTDYTATVRLDTRDISFFDAVYAVSDWWEKECGHVCAPVPDAARLPMNSAWYSYHQRIDPDEIVRQCELSKPLGMDTIIIDDGWQTDDNSRGYAYCGDWEVAPGKIPDVCDFVDRIHKTGMKVMFWYSVPFVGKYSKVYEDLKDKCLGPSYSKDWLVLDPRFPEVRRFLIGKYRQAVTDWHLDGLKLDFIDSFQLQPVTPLDDPRRDCVSLEEGLRRLLEETLHELTAVNPDILVEFRQRYMGPTVRRYGNMMRVGDCPDDAIKNRLGIIDLRLTSGKTAVHSDMVMWNYAEPVECAALQMVNILFGVPQVSMILDKLSPEHTEMLAFYLRFWREHRVLLLDGYLTARHPECGYTLAQTEKDGEILAVANAENLLRLTQDYKKIWFVNGCGDDTLVISGLPKKALPYRVLDCRGNIVCSGQTAENGGIAEFPVPLSGMVEIG